jgi:DNA-binding transcriptional ArsR family regulator
MKNKEILEFHAEFCKAFSHPHRLAILCLLKKGEMTVSEIAGKLGVSNAAASQHLTQMRIMRVLKARRDAQRIYYSIANRKLSRACGLMEDALSQLVEGVLPTREGKRQLG